MKWTLDDIVLIAIVCYLVLLPTLQYEPYRLNDTYNHKRLIQLLLFILIGISAIFPRNVKRLSVFINQYSKFTKIALAAVFLFGFIATIKAKYLDWALLDYGHYLLMVIITFFIGSIASDKPTKARGYVIACIIGYVVFYLGRVSFSYILYHLGEFKLWPSANKSIDLFGFSTIRTFNYTQTWTIPILASLGWYSWRYTNKQWLRWGLAAVVISWGMLVFASGVRGTILGVVIGAFIVWAVLIKEKKRFLLYCIILSLGAFLGYYFFFEILAEGTNRTAVRFKSNKRWLVWLEAVDGIFKQPIWGYGPMHFASIKLENLSSSPHNWFLQFSYEWGLPVGILVSMIFLNGLRSFANQLKESFSNQNKSSRKKWLELGLCWSIIAVFIHGLFSKLLISPPTQTFFVLIIGVSIGIYFHNNSNQKLINRSSSFYIQWIVIATVIFSFSSLTYWTFKNPINRNKLDSYYLREYQRNVLYPRYWMQGIIGVDTKKIEKDNSKTPSSDSRED